MKDNSNTDWKWINWREVRTTIEVAVLITPPMAIAVAILAWIAS